MQPSSAPPPVEMWPNPSSLSQAERHAGAVQHLVDQVGAEQDPRLELQDPRIESGEDRPDTVLV